MAKYWWVVGVAFVVSFGVYTVATGWTTRIVLHNNIRRATRQVEIENILADLARCQEALADHRYRVFLLAPVLRNPNFAAVDAVSYEIGNYQAYFQSLASIRTEDITLDPRFQSGTSLLKAYRVRSLSVLSTSGETGLEIALWGLGLLTVVLGLLRPLSSP